MHVFFVSGTYIMKTRWFNKSPFLRVGLIHIPACVAESRLDSSSSCWCGLACRTTLNPSDSKKTKNRENGAQKSTVQWRQYELPVLSARWERRCGVDELRKWSLSLFIRHVFSALRGNVYSSKIVGFFERVRIWRKATTSYWCDVICLC
jgi:hypothetical protein